MEAAWLQIRLESGRSIESIAREAGKAASTVAYWVTMEEAGLLFVPPVADTLRTASAEAVGPG